MAIFLLILKIIGFILLGLLALILLILLLLLFVPIRYQVTGRYDDGGPFADVKFSYLFPVVHGFVRVGNAPGAADKAGGAAFAPNAQTGAASTPAAKNLSVDTTGAGSADGSGKKKGHTSVPMEGGVKLLCFQIVNFFPTEEEKAESEAEKAAKEAKKAAKEAKKAAKKAAKKQKGGANTATVADTEGTSVEKQTEAANNTAPAESAVNNTADSAFSSDLSAAPLSDEDFDTEDTEENDDGLTLLDKIRFFLLKLPDVVRVITEKLFGIPDLLQKLFEKASEGGQKALKTGAAYKKFAERLLCIWEKPYTQAALKKGKRAILRILKGLCPRKGYVHITAGMEDIAVTGKLCGYYGMLIGMFYPFIGKRVVFVPDFDEKRYEGEAFLKGRFRLCACLDAAWLYFFDKDIKRLKRAYDKAKTELDNAKSAL